jgi:hypothetical protein
MDTELETPKIPILIWQTALLLVHKIFHKTWDLNKVWEGCAASSFKEV